MVSQNDLCVAERFIKKSEKPRGLPRATLLLNRVSCWTLPPKAMANAVNVSDAGQPRLPNPHIHGDFLLKTID